MLLVGGPDDATACAPCGARPVASGNLTTSSQVHLVAGASRAHPTRRLWRGRISWRCGDWEFGRSSSKSPKLQVSQQRKQQKAFVCLYRRSHLVILGEWLGNTGCEALVTGERRGRYGCKDCLYRVKGSWAMGVRSWFAAISRKFGGKLWYNGGKLPSRWRQIKVFHTQQRFLSYAIKEIFTCRR